MPASCCSYAELPLVPVHGYIATSKISKYLQLIIGPGHRCMSSELFLVLVQRYNYSEPFSALDLRYQKYTNHNF